jgi:GntR family transcriptional regulator
VDLLEARYVHLANELRAAIARGEYPPGTTLPKITVVPERYDTAKQAAQEAISILEAERLVVAVRRRGIVVARSRAPGGRPDGARIDQQDR